MKIHKTLFCLCIFLLSYDSMASEDMCSSFEIDGYKFGSTDYGIQCSADGNTLCTRLLYRNGAYYELFGTPKHGSLYKLIVIYKNVDELKFEEKVKDLDARLSSKSARINGTNVKYTRPNGFSYREIVRNPTNYKYYGWGTCGNQNLDELYLHGDTLHISKGSRISCTQGIMVEYAVEKKELRLTSVCRP